MRLSASSASRVRGFTLLELMIVIAVIAIVAAIAIPGLLRARLAANETSAIGSLRALSSAQFQWKNNAVVDQDGDGAGEFGYLQELAATEPPRILGGGFAANPVSPAYVTTVLGETARINGGVANKSGYSYLAYLPTEVGPAESEVGFPRTFLPGDASEQAVKFAIYAFPSSIGNSGNRAFVINQQGAIYATQNVDRQGYSGTTAASSILPPPGAAYIATPFQDPANLDGIFSASLPGDDGEIWKPAGN